MFFSLSDEQATVIRQKLLETLASESDRSVRNKISYAVAEIARQYIDNGALPICLPLANPGPQADPYALQKANGQSSLVPSSSSAKPQNLRSVRSLSVYSQLPRASSKNNMKSLSFKPSRRDSKTTPFRYEQ